MQDKIKFNTVITAAGMVFFQLSNFLLAIFIVRALGATELGNYQFFITTATFLSYFAKMGFDEKLSYLLPTLGGASSEQGKKLITHTLLQTLCYSLLILALCLVFLFLSQQGQISENLFIESLSYSLYFPSFVGGLILVSVLRAEQLLIKRSIVVYVLPNLLNFLFLIFLSSFFFVELSSLLARAWSYFAIFCFLLLLIKQKYGFSSLQGFRVKWPTEVSWLLLTATAFAIESGLIAIWYGKSELTSEEFGVFTILLRLSALVMLAPIALTIVIGPLMAKKPHDLTLRNKMLSLNALLVVATLIMLVLSAQYWLLFFGDQYTIYTKELKFLCLFMGVLAITQPLNSIFIAHNKKHWIYVPGVFVIMVFYLLVNAFTNHSLQAVLLSLEIVLALFAVSRVAYFILLLHQTNPLRSKGQ